MSISGLVDIDDRVIGELHNFIRHEDHRSFNRLLERIYDFPHLDRFREILATHDRANFGRRLRSLHTWALRSDYNANRRAQLLQASYRFWVYSLAPGGSCHPDWDGFTCSAEHAIWNTHFPANGWTCSCRVRGADTAAGVLRAGGNLERPLPAGWDTKDQLTGLPLGIEPGFDSPVFPDFRACLQAAGEGICAIPERT